MLRHLRVWCLLTLVAALSLAAGYALPHAAKKGGDMLDAVAAVQRHSPLFLMPERGCPSSWVREGGIYLSRKGKTADDVEDLVKDPRGYDQRWQGVVYFKACAHHDRVSLFLLSGAGDRLLDYGDFVIYGDPELLREVRSILESAGFEAAGGPSRQRRFCASLILRRVSPPGCLPRWAAPAASITCRGRRLALPGCRHPDPHLGVAGTGDGLHPAVVLQGLREVVPQRPGRACRHWPHVQRLPPEGHRLWADAPPVGHGEV
jgi:hypothetical protein